MHGTRYHFHRMARYCSGNNEPLTRWNNRPIYLTTILTALFVLGLIATAVLSSAHSPLLEWLIFTMPLTPAWSLWRLVSYVFIGEISFFTPFAILCFYWWSIGIETHLGRGVLTRLLALLALTGPAACVVWWTLGSASAAIGSYAFTGGLLVAFATLYPNTEAWGWIPFKWLTFACVACGSLMLLASRNWVALSQLWAACAAGFAFMRHAKETEYDDYEPPFRKFAKLFKRQPKFRVVPKPAAAARRSAGEEVPDVDALLEKISKSGIASLTANERARLDAARAALLKKESR
jgi:hypothetical protein